VSERRVPLVVAVCAVPVLGEALAGALEELAECKVVPAGQPDIAGLLRSLQPDAIVVDDEGEAEAAAMYSRFARIPVLYVAPTSRRLRVLENGRWEELEDYDASPEAIRNLVAVGLYGRKAAQ
jgi:hypothetical protein